MEWLCLSEKRSYFFMERLYLSPNIPYSFVNQLCFELMNNYHIRQKGRSAMEDDP